MLYLALWAHTGVLTLRRYQKIKQCGINLETLWRKRTPEILRGIGFDEISIESLSKEYTHIREQCIEKDLQSGKYGILNIDEPEYPALLKECPDAPVFLFYQGKLSVLQTPLLAIVGTRRMTAYGKQLTEEWTKSLVEYGITIVSGLALGVDGIAHRSALEYGGKTIAVLGSGICQIAPQSHTRLATDIKENGLLISESPPDEPPQAYHFPRRNRIIAGMSLGTLIVEAPESSGALITGQLALQYNREVFAIPGSVYSAESRGVHDLISRGEAKLVSRPEQILEELGMHFGGKNENLENTSVELSDEEQRVLSMLDAFPKTTHALMAALQCPISWLNGILTQLELKGLVRNVGFGQWIHLKKLSP